MAWYNCSSLLQPEIFSGPLIIKVSIKFSYHLQVVSHRTFRYLTLTFRDGREPHTALKSWVCLRKRQSLISVPSSLNQVWRHRSLWGKTIDRSPEKSYLPKPYLLPHTALYDFLTERWTQRWRLYDLLFPARVQCEESYLVGIYQIRSIIYTWQKCQQEHLVHRATLLSNWLFFNLVKMKLIPGSVPITQINLLNSLGQWLPL